MERMKVVELKALSKSLGLRDYSRLRKAELVKLIMDHSSSGPRPIPQSRQVKKPPEGIIRCRPPKPTRPPRPIPPPRPPVFQRYQLREKGSKVGDVQQPKGVVEPPKVKYDPKKLKHMKPNKKIRRSKKKHDNMIRRKNNLKKAIDEMVRSKPIPQSRPTPPPKQTEFRELEQAFGRVYRSYRTFVDPDTFFTSIREQLIQLISRELKELRQDFRQDFRFA